VRVDGCERGPGLEVLPGLRAFKWLDFAATIDDPDCQVAGRLELEGFRGPYRLTRFMVTAGLGMWPTALTGEAIRAVSIEDVVGAVLDVYGVELGGGQMPAHPDWQELVARSGPELRAAGIGDEDVLAVVAAVYMAALLSGRNPAEEVAARLDASPATAGRYIRAAKRRGRLRPTDRSV
jgi:hypothetical protein